MTIMKNFKSGVLAVLKNIGKVLLENIKLLTIGMILILMIIASAILISLYFGGDMVRQLTVSEIRGSAYITRGTKRLSLGKNAKLVSGDIVTTDKESTVRISVDDDKYIFVEPDSMIYVYFTDIASEGDISVNLSRGAAICELNEKLKKKATFTLKTPNSVVSVRGTVFRAEFDYMESYMDYRSNAMLSNVMITQIQNFDGSVNLQLYDSNKEPFDLPKLLTERTSAQMITADDFCQYGYLNYDIDLGTINENALHEILRASNEKQLAFTRDEVNMAYKRVVEENRNIEITTGIPTEEVSEEISITTTVPTTASTTERSVTTTTPPESTEESSNGTLRSTMKTYEYTTYSGIKWWELTGNTNTDTDDYEDWFTEETYFPSETETAVPEE